MFGQKTHLALASAAALFALTNGTLMATAYAADQGTEATAPCYGSQFFCKGPIGLQVREPRLQGPKLLQRSGI